VWKSGRRGRGATAAYNDFVSHHAIRVGNAKPLARQGGVEGRSLVLRQTGDGDDEEQ